MQHAEQLIKNYIPRASYTSILDQSLQRHNKAMRGTYIVMTGEDGSGKSSLLADWWLGFKKASNIPTFMFFIGIYSIPSKIIILLFHYL